MTKQAWAHSRHPLGRSSRLLWWMTYNPSWLTRRVRLLVFLHAPERLFPMKFDPTSILIAVALAVFVFFQFRSRASAWQTAARQARDRTGCGRS
jgi:hypothetical protein